VQGNPTAATAIEGVGIASGASDRLGLVSAVEEALESGRRGPAFNIIGDADDFGVYEELQAEGADGMSRAFLKIEDGCDAYCSYCYVPYVRGHVRSRSIQSIEDEAKKLAEAGYAEVILTGIHLGCYGRDFGGRPGLIDAIKAVCKADGIMRVRLSSLEPTELTDALIALFASEPKLARHLHLPLQSGDNSILKSMNRHYDANYFESAVAKARERLGDIGLTTDIIVGFPGETDETFENTVALVKRVGFLHVHVFPYSKRAGTPAATMKDQVPEGIKSQRVRRLIAVSAAIAKDRHDKMVGKEYEVVIESEALDASGIFTYEGYTSEYVKVSFTSAKSLKGMAYVRISSSSGEGAAGEHVE